MRDEKEGRKKQAWSNKQQSKVTQYMYVHVIVSIFFLYPSPFVIFVFLFFLFLSPALGSVCLLFCVCQMAPSNCSAKERYVMVGALLFTHVLFSHFPPSLSLPPSPSLPLPPSLSLPPSPSPPLSPFLSPSLSFSLSLYLSLSLPPSPSLQDSVVYPRLLPHEEYATSTNHHLEALAVDGLRTLCVAERTIQLAEYEVSHPQLNLVPSELSNLYT